MHHRKAYLPLLPPILDVANILEGPCRAFHDDLAAGDHLYCKYLMDKAIVVPITPQLPPHVTGTPSAKVDAILTGYSSSR